MKKWLWTFGCDTMFAKKYVIVTTTNGDGRDVLYQVYGKDNLASAYSLDFEPYKEGKLREEYGYKKIGAFIIDSDCITAVLDRIADGAVVLTLRGTELTNAFKHQIWDNMIGGI